MLPKYVKMGYLNSELAHMGLSSRFLKQVGVTRQQQDILAILAYLSHQEASYSQHNSTIGDIISQCLYKQDR